MSAENELLEREAKARGLSVTQYLMLKATPDSLMRDLMADARRGISNSASMIPDRERKQPTARGTGWVEPPKVRPPDNIELIDAMCGDPKALREKAEKLAKINMQAYEDQRRFEQEQRRRDRELDPYDTGIYGPTYDDK
jgi:hypothetical protein